jgi:hypothetical protein
MISDPLTAILDPKPIAVGFLAVTLYVSSMVLEYKILDRIARLLSNQSKQQDDFDQAEKERIKVVTNFDGLIKTVEYNEHKLDAALKYLQEHRVLLDSLVIELHEINKQQTVLATAQLNQTQGTNRVIDGLLDALSEQTKE